MAISSHATRSRDDDIADLFDALTTGAPCTSYDDIAARSGLARKRVGNLLSYLRRPHVAASWGWTVPHVPRGVGAHRFQVVLLVDPQTLSTSDLVAHKRGARSTLRHVASSGASEAYALRAIGGHFDAANRRRLTRIANALDGAAAMAADAADLITAGTV